MRFLFAILISLFFVSPSFADYGDPASTVNIRTLLKDRHFGAGSGTYIGQNRILTASHVVGHFKGKERVDLKIQFRYKAQMVNAKVDWSDNNLDLAIIKFVDNLDLKAVPISCELAPVGTKIRADGFPMWMGKVSTWGYVSGLPQTNEQWKDFFVIQMPIIMGQSGASIISDEGNIVGVLIAIPGVDLQNSKNMGITGYVTGLAFAVSSPKICEAIEEHK